MNSMPATLNHFNDLLALATCDIGHYGIMWPSRRGKSVFVVTGDGLYQFALEIVSFEGEGCFRLVKEDRELPSMARFKNFTGDYGTDLTTAQVEETLRSMFGIAKNEDDRIETLRERFNPGYKRRKKS